MLQRLDYDEKRNIRGEFEHALGVRYWVTPFDQDVVRIPIEGPWWWRGDEEASGTFLSSMGVNLDG